MAGNKSRKDLVVKKAIREIATEKKIARRKVTTYQILEYMLNTNLGTRWATKNSIKMLRQTLPKIYREEL